MARILNTAVSDATPTAAVGVFSRAKGNPSSRHCDCGERARCHCATSHQTGARRRGRTHERPSSRDARRHEASVPRLSEPGGLVAKAHPKELRPVLPRLPTERGLSAAMPARIPVQSGKPRETPSWLPEQPICTSSGQPPVYAHDEYSIPAQCEPDWSRSFGTFPPPMPDAAWMPQSTIGTADSSDIFHMLYECGPTCLCSRNSLGSGSIVHPPVSDARTYTPMDDPGTVQDDAPYRSLSSSWSAQLLAHGPLSSTRTRIGASQFFSRPPAPQTGFAVMQAAPSHGPLSHLTSSTTEFGDWCGRCAYPTASCICPDFGRVQDVRTTLDFAVSGERASCYADAGSAAVGDDRNLCEQGWMAQASAGDHFLGMPYSNMSRGSSMSSASSGHGSSLSSSSMFSGSTHYPSTM